MYLRSAPVVTQVTPCWYFGLSTGSEGENSDSFAWKQCAVKMPAADLESEMNDAFLAGIPFRWDSVRICFSLVPGLSTSQPPSL